jgi:hypothetical protein
VSLELHEHGGLICGLAGGQDRGHLPPGLRGGFLSTIRTVATQSSLAVFATGKRGNADLPAFLSRFVIAFRVIPGTIPPSAGDGRSAGHRDDGAIVSPGPARLPVRRVPLMEDAQGNREVAERDEPER